MIRRNVTAQTSDVGNDEDPLRINVIRRSFGGDGAIEPFSACVLLLLLLLLHPVLWETCLDSLHLQHRFNSLGGKQRSYT